MLLQEIHDAAAPASLTHHWAGYTALVIFGLAYLIVVFEEKLNLRKSKPVMVAAGLIWMLIGIAYLRMGDTTTAAAAIRHNVGDFAELLLFIVVAVTFVNTMEERGVFDALRAALVARGFSLRALFWITGLCALFLSSQIDNLTTALVLGTVVLTLGRGNPKFIALGCINVVVAANAGGAWSPFGDITTLMVWQSGEVGFWQFYRLFLPSLVNWFVPAFFMQFALPKVAPEPVFEDVHVKRGGWTVVALFAFTIAMTVSAYNLLKLPPFIGMTTGLGLLKLFSYGLKRTRPRWSRQLTEVMESLTSSGENPPREPTFVRDGEGAPALAYAQTSVQLSPSAVRIESRQLVLAPALPARAARPYETFDVFGIMQRSEWDTLLFFYGIILCVGGLATIGYLSAASHALYGGLGPTVANVVVGLISAVVDNIPVMFAVLSMSPDLNLTQWLLVTLTAGVGGSLLSVGSAAGVALMGHARGQYTFMSHLRWTWAIALGYAASIGVHLLING
ncbi:MAG: sodium:proton antiporter NhaD [Gemmatimonadota bacterium]